MRSIRKLGAILLGSGILLYLLPVADDYRYVLVASAICTVGTLLFHCKSRDEKVEAERNAVSRHKQLERRIGPKAIRSIQVGSAFLAMSGLLIVLFFAITERDGTKLWIGLAAIFGGMILGAISSPPKIKPQPRH